MLNKPFVIGVDIGGTTAKYGIVNENGKIAYNGILATQQYSTAEQFVAALYMALLPSVTKVGLNNIKGIGIGAPNGNYYTGFIEYAPNLPWGNKIPLVKMIEQTFNLPCCLTNDANAAAVGEMIYGAAQGMKNFIVLTLGTGVGSGIVCNGALVYGHDGFAGELGHIVARRGRKHWSTGKDGSLETYVSATGIVITAKILLKQSNAPSLLRGYEEEEIDAKLICEFAMQGDAIAKEVFEYTGEVLGEALSNFVMFSSPEAIILFGGVTKAGDLLLKPTIDSMEKNLLPIYQNKVKILYSQLSEANAAILGASALIYDKKIVSASVIV